MLNVMYTIVYYIYWYVGIYPVEIWNIIKKPEVEYFR